MINKPLLEKETLNHYKEDNKDSIIYFKYNDVVESLKKIKNKLNKIENKYMFGKNGKINFREYFYSLYQDIFELNNIDFEECFGILSKEEKK